MIGLHIALFRTIEATLHCWMEFYAIPPPFSYIVQKRHPERVRRTLSNFLLFVVHSIVYFLLSLFSASGQPVLMVGGKSEIKVNNISRGI